MSTSKCLDIDNILCIKRLSENVLLKSGHLGQKSRTSYLSFQIIS